MKTAINLKWLTEAQRYALTGHACFDKDGKLAVELKRYRQGGMARATWRKLTDLGLVEPQAIRGSARMTSLGERVADELLAPRTLREMLRERQERRDAEKAEWEARERREVEFARKVAEHVPPGIDAGHGREDLRSRLANGEEYGDPIREVTLTVADLARLLGVPVEEGDE